MVDAATALRVVDEEQSARNRAAAGAYGVEATARAERLGLTGIVWMWTQRGRRVFVEDLMGAEHEFPTFPAYSAWAEEQRRASATE